MTFTQIKAALYATYLTNYYGFKCKGKNNDEILKIRDEYARKLMDYLGLTVVVENPEKAPKKDVVLLVNHKSVIGNLLGCLLVLTAK